MSSSAPDQGPGGDGAAPTAAAQRYFCHQCDCPVIISPSSSPSGELLCPICDGGFIEEFDLPPSNPNPNPSAFVSFESHHSDSFMPPFLYPSLSSAAPAAPAATSFDVRTPGDLAGLFAGIGGGGTHNTTFRSSSSSSALGPEPFNPIQFVQNYLQSMLGDNANIQFVFEGGSGGGSPFGGGNFGDYFIGPGLEQLIQQLAENDPNRYGTPPAAKSAVDSLPIVKINQELIDADDGAQCAVCKDEFEIGVEAKQMPCKHLYHKDCVVPWLELHNSCPVCRFELPTDDPNYENRRRGMEEGQGLPAVERRNVGIGLAAAAAEGGAEGNAVGGGPRAVERRFRIQLPWPLGSSGSQTDVSNAGSGGSGSRGSGGNGGGGSDGSGAETRQEDLD